MRGLAGAAIAAGATVFTASPVEHIGREGRLWRLATQGGTVRAKWAVLSTDTYTSRIFPELRGEQVVLPFFHVATAPLSHRIRHTILPEGHGAWDTRTVLTAFRTDNAGRLIVGSVGALRGTGTVIHRNWARRRIRALFPQIGEIELEHEWYGRIGITNDHLPRLHLPADEASRRAPCSAASSPAISAASCGSMGCSCPCPRRRTPPSGPSERATMSSVRRSRIYRRRANTRRGAHKLASSAGATTG